MLTMTESPKQSKAKESEDSNRVEPGSAVAAAEASAAKTAAQLKARGKESK